MSVNEQVRQREKNLEALIGLGVDPYPYSYEVTHHAREVIDAFETLETGGAEVSLAGRLMAIRSHGKSTFAHLQDRTGRIQVYFIGYAGWLGRQATNGRPARFRRRPRARRGFRPPRGRGCFAAFGRPPLVANPCR